MKDSNPNKFENGSVYFAAFSLSLSIGFTKYYVFLAISSVKSVMGLITYLLQLFKKSNLLVTNVILESDFVDEMSSEKEVSLTGQSPDFKFV